jgi:hypothetical protein
MVLFQIKKGEKDTFLYETTAATSNDVVVRELAEIWNMRLRISQLCGAVREMGQYGPMKKPDAAGLDEVSLLSFLSCMTLE